MCKELISSNRKWFVNLCANRGTLPNLVEGNPVLSIFLYMKVYRLSLMNVRE
nr:MAG TPA: hypothetical protein [Caudoviricetes sp.]